LTSFVEKDLLHVKDYIFSQTEEPDVRFILGISRNTLSLFKIS